MGPRAKSWLCVVTGCVVFWAGVPVILCRYPPLDVGLFLAFCLIQLTDYNTTSRILSRYRNAGLVASKLSAIALGAVLLAYGETAMLAAGCVLYIAILAWNWWKHKRR